MVDIQSPTAEIRRRKKRKKKERRRKTEITGQKYNPPIGLLHRAAIIRANRQNITHKNDAFYN